jgi:FlaA1/EpsC-like NDP-sugar epimerase
LDLGQNGAISHDLIVGDICDQTLLANVFKRYGPEIVLHAAACKHVSLMEENPFAAAWTNVLGTLQIVQAASAYGAEKMAVISTDKAVIPAGIMGATKRIAELLVLANRSATEMNAVRLGNVLGSSGSVVPILQRQIARGGPITITDAACTRYFVTIGEAVQRLLSALVVDHRSAILVAPPGNAYRIIDLAHSLLESAVLDRRQIECRFTGLRPGGKISEQMTSDEESVAMSSASGLQVVLRGPRPSDQLLNDAIEEIDAALEHRDLSRLLQAILSVVPEYSPSVSLQRQLSEEMRRKTTA